MSLSWDCVFIDDPQCRNLCVGALPIDSSEGSTSAVYLIAIKRMSDDVCKVKVIS